MAIETGEPDAGFLTVVQGNNTVTGGPGADTFDLGTNAGWDVAFDFNRTQDRFALGGMSWLGFLTIDADGDGQIDDTLLGYAGGNFVAIGVSGLSLSQWNALVDAPVSATASAKMIADADIEPLAAWVDPLMPQETGYMPDEVDSGLSPLTQDISYVQLQVPAGWGIIG